MKEGEIKIKLKDYLQSRYSKELLFAEELKIEKGFVKADLVAFYHKWQCFEIKSNYDSLRRLEHQIFFYSSYFYKTTIVCGSTHAKKILKSTPDWIGVIEISSKDKFAYLRSPKPSPIYDQLKILSCLWKEEVIDLAGKSSIDLAKKQMTKQSVIGMFLAAGSSRKVNQLAQEYLIKRKQKRLEHDKLRLHDKCHMAVN